MPCYIQLSRVLTFASLATNGWLIIELRTDMLGVLLSRRPSPVDKPHDDDEEEDDDDDDNDDIVWTACYCHQMWFIFVYC